MKASHSFFAAAIIASAINPAMARRNEMVPATQAAILAGAEACIGSTTDPAGVDARLIGWQAAPAGSFKTNGRALMRDHVLVAMTPGRSGGCVVVARAQADFHALTLLADLEANHGAKRVSDAPPVLRFPNGELMRVNAGAKRGGPTYIHLAFASAKGK